jgi:hypothetical protein
VTAAVPTPARPGFLAGVAVQLRDPGAPFAPIFHGLAPAEDGAIAPSALAANVGGLQPPPPAAETPRLLAEALRELLFHYLFLAGERLPGPADEALGTVVRRRLTALEGLAVG